MGWTIGQRQGLAEDADNGAVGRHGVGGDVQDGEGDGGKVSPWGVPFQKPTQRGVTVEGISEGRIERLTDELDGG